jgi:hypothetical protein
MKKFFAAGMAVVMLLGMLSGCSDSYRLSDDELLTT